jgi:hypothetical protein
VSGTPNGKKYHIIGRKMKFSGGATITQNNSHHHQPTDLKLASYWQRITLWVLMLKGRIIAIAAASRTAISRCVTAIM